MDFISKMNTDSRNDAGISLNLDTHCRTKADIRSDFNRDREANQY